MVLDDKLVAHHRRILVRLFSDPHVDTIGLNLLLRAAQIESVSFKYYCVSLQCEDAQRLPTASYEHRARQQLNGVSLFCLWEGSTRPTNDVLHVL